jgi:hypothetical protein
MSVLRTLSPALVIIAAALLRHDRRLIRRLRREGALSPETAVSLPPRNVIAQWRLKRLMGTGAVVRVRDTQRVYLDESAWRAFRSSRRRVALVLLGGVLAAWLVWWAWFGTR